MAHPQEESLIAQLPGEAAEPLRRALAQPDPKSKDAGDPLRAALKAVAFPEGRIFPLAASLTAPQRALAEILAHREGLSVYPHALPAFGLRKRWLGLEPGGVLESEQVPVEGQPQPLWRALQLAGFDYARAGAILNALPLERGLLAFGEIYPFNYNLNGELIFNNGQLRFLEALHGEGRAWAAETADRLAAEPARLGAMMPLRWLAFTALVRAQAPIEPRWDPLLPLGPGPLGRELVTAIPAERRAAAVVAALHTQAQPANGILPAVELLEALPMPEVVAAVVAQLEKAGAFPGREEVKPRLQALGGKHPALAKAVAEALGLPTPPPPGPPAEVARPPEPVPPPSKPELEQEPAPKKSAGRKPAKAEKKPAEKKEPAKKPEKKPAEKKPAAKKPAKKK